VVNYDVKDIRVAVMDQSRTNESRRLIETFEGNRIFRITHNPDNQEDLERLLLKGKVDLGVKIPPDLSARIRKGDTAQVQVLADGSMSNMASMRISYTMLVVDRFNRAMIREISGRTIDYGSIDARIRTWYNPNMDSRNFFVPAIVAFVIMLISLLLTSIAVIREREQGTMEQLIATPARPHEIVIGKLIPHFFLGFIQLSLVVSIGTFLFKVPFRGNLFLLIFVSALFLVCGLGIGLFISTVAKSQQLAFMLSIIFTLLPSFLLSGFIFPISSMPKIIQFITYLVPAKYFLIVIRGILLKGTGLPAFWSEVLALFLLATLIVLACSKRMKLRLE